MDQRASSRQASLGEFELSCCVFAAAWPQAEGMLPASIAAVVLATMVTVVEMPVMAAAVMPTVVPIWPATTEQQQP
ncbi:hypothetical protein C163_12175 [Pseudomonas sp. FGI182]|nr:hypothetical protein C163_12175 [Pseudomonas sp. FGI182]